MSQSAWPENVGIVAMELYFPSQYVDQTELETFDNASPGKYTIGLGQKKMGFCSDREDINSLCLTVVQNLLKRIEVPFRDIGHLEVGTETLIDKSKSTKTVLMQLFDQFGNTDMEGVDCTNACYGGTAALFNALNWVESSAWDGRYALVVAGDIAVYASGNARCTGGAGAVALLVGPNAPLIVERGVRSSYMKHVYDFYKPDMSSEYPTVDGPLSIDCYLSSLDACFKRYTKKARKMEKLIGKSFLDMADAFIFHSPFCKLVQKSFARLFLNDFLSDNDPDYDGRYQGLENFRNKDLQTAFKDKEVEKAFVNASKNLFEAKTRPSLLVSNQVGNMYTPSVYGGLASYISSQSVESIAGQRVVLFSYGSGLASSMFSLTFNEDTTPKGRLDLLVKSFANLQERLDSRQRVPPAEFDSNMKLREQTHHLAPYSPVGSIEALSPDTWYLKEIDDKHKRIYGTKPGPMTAKSFLAADLAPQDMKTS